MDSISRSPFQIGDKVVVCDRQHVMLAEFYDGECPSCRSRKTVTFSRRNVEMGTLKSYMGPCPVCSAQLAVLLRKRGAGWSYGGKCPKCGHEFSLSAAFIDRPAQREKFKTYIGRVNAVLAWLLGLLIAGVIVFSLAGAVPHDRFVLHVENTAWPRILSLLARVPDFIGVQELGGAFAASGGLIAERTAALLVKGAALLSLWWAVLQQTYAAAWNRTMRILTNSKGMWTLIVYKTKLLLEWIGSWVSMPGVGGMSI